MDASDRLVLLVQLPIPPPGPRPIHGNVPLAAAYLKLFARRQGLEGPYRIELLPAPLTNALSDRGIVEEILSREPWLVGFTCCLWNIERTLWIAQQVKQARPDVRIVVGGPEITSDNAWVLRRPELDYAVIGEGEQTFAELLEALRHDPTPSRPIPGLAVLPQGGPVSLRSPLRDLNAISSPYLEGILDAADEKLLLLETTRGCRFRCKFCYYPKSYDAQYFLSPEKIIANLAHAARRGAREVTLLDPTLNQRRDFADFLRLLARHNPDWEFTYSAELRSEGIGAEEARLLREANFNEIEIGLQSLDPKAQELMGRKVNLKSFERGARAMIDAGINLRVDLILGLPGDTVDSVRRGIDYLQRSRLYTEMQVFNLSILPGTAFRQEAETLGLVFQPRPPYYVLETPTLTTEDLYLLMQEAQDAFGLEFDPFPPPQLDLPDDAGDVVRAWHIDLDAEPSPTPPASRRAHVFTLWLRSADFDRHRTRAADLVRSVLTDNPHSTLQIVVEPAAEPERLTERTLQAFQEACYASTSYLDLFYSLHPNPLLGAKRLIVLLPLSQRARLGPAWIDLVGNYAALAWSGGELPEEELAIHEYLV
jgi:MoaA/NifB/PqqE/SkfB family radical SAM enzyme